MENRQEKLLKKLLKGKIESIAFIRAQGKMIKEWELDFVEGSQYDKQINRYNAMVQMLSWEDRDGDKVKILRSRNDEAGFGGSEIKKQNIHIITMNDDRLEEILHEYAREIEDLYSHA